MHLLYHLAREAIKQTNFLPERNTGGHQGIAPQKKLTKPRWFQRCFLSKLERLILNQFFQDLKTMTFKLFLWSNIISILKCAKEIIKKRKLQTILTYKYLGKIPNGSRDTNTVSPVYKNLQVADFQWYERVCRCQLLQLILLYFSNSNAPADEKCFLIFEFVSLCITCVKTVINLV